MSGSRRGRLAALAAAAVLAAVVVLASSGTPSSAGPPNCTVDPLPVGCETSSTESSTTILDTTTTTVEETTTTFVQTTTTTHVRTATTAEVVRTTTSTSLDVATSQNVLVPGDGTEGAESTTTTSVVPTTVSNDGTSDGALLALIIGGLVALAVLVGILTWRYWVATRPPLAPPVGSENG